MTPEQLDELLRSVRRMGSWAKLSMAALLFTLYLVHQQSQELRLFRDRVGELTVTTNALSGIANRNSQAIESIRQANDARSVQSSPQQNNSAHGVFGQ